MAEGAGATRGGRKRSVEVVHSPVSKQGACSVISRKCLGLARIVYIYTVYNRVYDHVFSKAVYTPVFNRGIYSTYE